MGQDDELSLDLVRRIQGGDRDAWTALYARLHDELLFSVRCRLGPGLRRHLQSEDVLQSVMLEAMGELEDFVPRADASLRHFLNVLITNKIRDRVDTYSAKKREGTVALTDSVAAAMPEGGGELRYHEAARYERLERAMARLPAEMQEVILLRRVEGLSGKEAAERLEKGEEATRKLFSRAMARLSVLMSESEDER